MQEGGKGKSWREPGLYCRVDNPPVTSSLCGLFTSVGRYLISLLVSITAVPMSPSATGSQRSATTLYLVIHSSNLHILKFNLHIYSLIPYSFFFSPSLADPFQGRFGAACMGVVDFWAIDKTVILEHSFEICSSIYAFYSPFFLFLFSPRCARSC